MSHYLVAVFTEGPEQSIEGLLAPYDEDMSVAPYVSKTREQVIEGAKKKMQWTFEHKYAEWQRDTIAYEQGSSPEHIAYLKDLPDLMKRSDEELYQELVKDYSPDELSEDGGILSTYNPNSKWDWYVVGGRWKNRLKLKADTSKDGCNEAYAKDIDFAATNLAVYAAVTPDGAWHAPGEMGWWGTSSESENERIAWNESFHETFIKPSLENGWYLTIVDCHI